MVGERTQCFTHVQTHTYKHGDTRTDTYKHKYACTHLHIYTHTYILCHTYTHIQKQNDAIIIVCIRALQWRQPKECKNNLVLPITINKHTLFLSGTTLDSSPIKISVNTLLSWASSIMITVYLLSRKSYKTQ